MKASFLNKANSSTFLWLDNLLCQEGSGFVNSSSLFYKTQPQFKGLNTYSSPYSQFIYDSSISGANIMSGVYVNGNFVTAGQSGLYGIDYNKGQVHFSGSLPDSAVISGNFAIKDFNIILNNEPEEKILFETKYSQRNKTSSTPTGLMDNETTYPVIFVSNTDYSNSPFSFGGEVSTDINYSLIIFSDDKFKLDSVVSLICDQDSAYIPVFSPQEMPFNIYGIVKSGVFSYEGIKALKNPGNQDSLFVSKVRQAKFSQKLYSEIDNLNPEVYVGIVDLNVNSQRMIR